MSKTIIAIVILALLITGGILDNMNVDKVFDQFDEKLNSLKTLVEAENKEESIKQLKETTAWWDDKKTKME